MESNANGARTSDHVRQSIAILASALAIVADRRGSEAGDIPAGVLRLPSRDLPHPAHAGAAMRLLRQAVETVKTHYGRARPPTTRMVPLSRRRRRLFAIWRNSCCHNGVAFLSRAALGLHYHRVACGDLVSAFLMLGATI